MNPRSLSLGWLVLAALWWVPLGVGAVTPVFEEVGPAGGIDGRGETFGASWGDLDGDGWPDLWVSNHALRPNLYRNQHDGTFRDVLDERWEGDPTADTHAAAWGDADGDGDADLLSTVGAIITDDDICLGCAANFYYENQGGTLRERAEAVGLDGAKGFARTPLWLDADRDGALDLLIVNQRAKSNPPSLLFRQRDGRFVDAGFTDPAPTRVDKAKALLRNAMAMRFYAPDFRAEPSRAFAQLADLDGDDQLDLVYHGVPFRVFSLGGDGLREITADLGFPAVGQTSDAAIEDFDGDGRMDLYLTRGPYTTSTVIAPTPDPESKLRRLRMRLGVAWQGPATGPGVAFASDGPIVVALHYPYWYEPEEIFLGDDGAHPHSRMFRLEPGDVVGAPHAPSVRERRGVQIGYDGEAGEWVLRNGSRVSMEVEILAAQPIADVRRLDFRPFRERGVDALLLAREDGFAEKALVGSAGGPTACHSVTAGDFDNDMDVDLYLVCSAPISNLGNRLLLNDGTGRFTAVEGDFGARGTARGRGDTATSVDFDRDGALDLFVTNGSDPGSYFVADAPHQLFRNRGNGNHWLEVDLVGAGPSPQGGSNADGVGAVLRLEAGGVVQRREQDGGMHVFSQDHPRVHFGLGPHGRADRLTIHWPSGRVSELSDVPADQVLVVREPDA